MAPAYFYVGQRLTDYANVDMTVEREASGGFGAVAMGPNRGGAKGEQFALAGQNGEMGQQVKRDTTQT